LHLLREEALDMKIILLSDDAVRLEPVPGAMTIEAISAEQSYSPFHMLASALAVCTFSVMEAWATHASLAIDDLAVEVRWTFAEDPHRVDAIHLTFEWPSLPAKRYAAARRVAEMCTVHSTLMHPPAITVDVSPSEFSSESLQSTSDEHAHSETAS
jgi:uncharacterized OsmC-like protein